MPDGTVNFSVDTVNAPVDTDATSRDEFINILQHLNYATGNVRAVDEITDDGMLFLQGSSDAAAVRTFEGTSGLTWTNADGSGGNPSVGIGTPYSTRQTLDDSESDTITANKAISILTTGTSYAVPAPDSGKISRKTIINDTSEMITLTGSVWADSSVTTVRIPPEGIVELVSNLTQKWWASHHGVKNAMGAIYVTTAQATTCTDNGTYYEDNSVYALNNSESRVHQFSLGADSRLTYTGKVPIHAHVACSVSTTSSNSTNDVTMRLARYDSSGTILDSMTHSEVIQNMKTTEESAATHGDFVMEENDYIILEINHGTNGATVTTQTGYLFALGIPILTT